MNKLVNLVVITDRDDGQKTIIEVFKDGTLPGTCEIQVEKFENFKKVRVEEKNLELILKIMT